MPTSVTIFACEFGRFGFWRLACERFSVVLLALIFLPFAALGANRPLPESVDIRVLAKQEANDLRLLVRVPLSVVRDIQFPVRGEIGYLDLSAVQMVLQGASRYWIQGCFDVYEGGEQITDIEIVKARISPFSDESFASVNTAMAHFSEPVLGNDVNVIWNQTWLDIYFTYPLDGRQRSLAVLPKVAHLGARVSTEMQYTAPGKPTRRFAFDGNPGSIYLEPRTVDVAKQFLQHGISFVAWNADLLLFIFCLVLPVRRLHNIRAMAVIFAVSLTVGLLTPALGFFPRSVGIRPLIETISALAILVAAVMNIGQVYSHSRTVLAAIAGLVYGISSYSDLGDKIQFSGIYSQSASVAYWLGLVLAAELGIGLLIPVLRGLFKTSTRRLELIVVSGLAADAAFGWLQDRWLQLRKVPWQMPALNADFFALILQFLAVVVLAGGFLWFLRGWRNSRRVLNSADAPDYKDITS